MAGSALTMNRGVAVFMKYLPMHAGIGNSSGDGEPGQLAAATYGLFSSRRRASRQTSSSFGMNPETLKVETVISRGRRVYSAS